MPGLGVLQGLACRGGAPDTPHHVASASDAAAGFQPGRVVVVEGRRQAVSTRAVDQLEGAVAGGAQRPYVGVAGVAGPEAGVDGTVAGRALVGGDVPEARHGPRG